MKPVSAIRLLPGLLVLAALLCASACTPEEKSPWENLDYPSAIKKNSSDSKE